MAKHKRLHIGGKVTSDGWEVLNVVPGPHVNHVFNANNLSKFHDNSFTEIYASHVLEHFDYNGELKNTLIEWHRVLEPGGKIFISVPDLDALAELILAKNELSVNERFEVMRVIFGGHVDKYDYHLVGLNEEFLTNVLITSGFVKIKRVKFFGLFDDTSSNIFKGVPISLNMIAEKPADI